MIQLFPDFARPRHHSQQFLHRTEFANLLQLVEEVFQSQLTLLNLAGQLFGLLHIEGFLSLFDEAQQVAHIQNPRRHPVGMEPLKVVQALPGRGEQHRNPGNAPD